MRILVGKKIKEPNSGSMAEEEKPAGREGREEKKNCCPSTWFFQFKNAMSNKVVFQVLFIVTSVSPKIGFVYCQQ